MKNKKSKFTSTLSANSFSRSIVLDSARGFLVLCMIFYHILFTLNFISLVPINMNSFFMWLFPRTVAALFIFVFGISIRYAREKATSFTVLVKKTLPLIGLALCISIITFIALGSKQFVLFGILHLMAVLRIVLYPIGKKPYIAFFIGLVVLSLGLFLGEFKFDFMYLAPLGFRPSAYYPIDFEPILPWAAYACFGISFASILLYFKEKKSKLFTDLNRKLSSSRVFKALSFLGKKSLIVYAIHIPIIFVVLYGIKLLIGLFQ